MKQNIVLQQSLNFANYAQRALYKAFVLQSALVSSNPVEIRKAVKSVLGKRQIPAYVGFAGTAALTASQNTTGFAAGERFPGRPAVPAQPASNGYAAVATIPALPPSPAYAAGVAVPAYPAVPSRTEQVEVLPIPEVKSLIIPKIDAVKGYENAITISKSESTIMLSVELPVVKSTGIVGSDLIVVGEITPTTLQALEWLDARAQEFPSGCGATVDADFPEESLERSLYRDILLCDHTVVDSVRIINGIPVSCKKVEAVLYVTPDYDPSGKSLQLDKVLISN